MCVCDIYTQCTPTSVCLFRRHGLEELWRSCFDGRTALTWLAIFSLLLAGRELCSRAVVQSIVTAAGSMLQASEPRVVISVATATGLFRFHIRKEMRSCRCFWTLMTFTVSRTLLCFQEHDLAWLCRRLPLWNEPRASMLERSN